MYVCMHIIFVQPRHIEEAEFPHVQQQLCACRAILAAKGATVAIFQRVLIMNTKQIKREQWAQTMPQRIINPTPSSLPRKPQRVAPSLPLLCHGVGAHDMDDVQSSWDTFQGHFVGKHTRTSGVYNGVSILFHAWFWVLSTVCLYITHTQRGIFLGILLGKL